MELLLKYIGPVLGLASAIVTLTTFHRDRIKHNTLLLVSSLVFSSVIIFVWDRSREKEYDVQLLEEKQRYEYLIARKENELIAQDAKAIADSVVITGYEDYGDYIAYLSTMVGFYRRHQSIYEHEYTTLSRQLNEWQEDLRKIRNSGKSIYYSDYDGLRGLVRSTQDYLRRISTKDLKSQASGTL